MRISDERLAALERRPYEDIDGQDIDDLIADLREAWAVLRRIRDKPRLQPQHFINFNQPIAMSKAVNVALEACADEVNAYFETKS